MQCGETGPICKQALSSTFRRTSIDSILLSYISYRQSYAHHPAKKTPYGARLNGFAPGTADSDERRGLMSAGAFEGDGDAIIEMDLLPPRWMDVQDEVTELLARIVEKSAQLDKLHQKHVLPGFDDEDVKKREEIAIERLTQDITRGFHECQKAIQRIEKMVKDARDGGGVSKGDETMAKNIQISLAGRVQEVSAGFRKKQSTYLKSRRSIFLLSSLWHELITARLSELRQLGGMSTGMDRSYTPVQNPYSDPSMIESETDKSFSQSTLQQSAQKHIVSNDSAIAQREREINDIARGIIELADIFKDLQTMVIDQGTMLDRIDYNVERMTVDVKAAEKELVVVCLLTTKDSRHHELNQVTGYGIPEKEHQTNDPPVTPSTCRRHVHFVTGETQEVLSTADDSSATSRPAPEEVVHDCSRGNTYGGAKSNDHATPSSSIS
ncbi:hypothetical protein MMC25_001996 [Agyrium rufum]|nr:hypothetical protein [Agyrium rufum]